MVSRPRSKVLVLDAEVLVLVYINGFLFLKYIYWPNRGEGRHDRTFGAAPPRRLNSQGGFTQSAARPPLFAAPLAAR